MFMPLPFENVVGGGAGHTVSPLSVHPVCSLSFEKVSILDSYFIHRYIIKIYRLSSMWGKIHQLLWEL